MKKSTFEFVGKLYLGKESEIFKPWEEKTFESGWNQRTLKANVNANGNNLLLTLRAGYMGEDSKTQLYDVDKKEKFSIKYKERFDGKVLDRLKGYQYSTLDCYGKNRWLIEKTYKDFKDGKDVAEAVSTLGITKEEIEAEYEKSQKMIKHFIYGYDFAEALHKVATNPKLKDKIWKIRGDVDFSFYEGKFYINYVPNKVYLTDGSDEEKATANIQFYFGEGAVNDYLEDNNEFTVDGKVPYYDGNIKGEQYADYKILVKGVPKTDENADKKNKIRMKRFTVTGEHFKELGVVVNLLRGAENVEISEDDLTEEQQDALFCGDITMDDIRREYGQVKGNFREANVFSKIMKGYSTGPKDTDFTADDLVYKVPEENEPEVVDYDDDEEDEDDIFGDIE